MEKRTEKTYIFTDIMNFIEQNTDIPRLMSSMANWLEDDKNKSVYEIYMKAVEARNKF